MYKYFNNIFLSMLIVPISLHLSLNSIALDKVHEIKGSFTSLESSDRYILLKKNGNIIIYAVIDLKSSNFAIHNIININPDNIIDLRLLDNTLTFIEKDSEGIFSLNVLSINDPNESKVIQTIRDIEYLNVPGNRLLIGETGLMYIVNHEKQVFFKRDKSGELFDSITIDYNDKFDLSAKINNNIIITKNNYLNGLFLYDIDKLDFNSPHNIESDFPPINECISSCHNTVSFFTIFDEAYVVIVDFACPDILIPYPGGNTSMQRMNINCGEQSEPIQIITKNSDIGNDEYEVALKWFPSHGYSSVISKGDLVILYGSFDVYIYRFNGLELILLDQISISGDNFITQIMITNKYLILASKERGSAVLADKLSIYDLSTLNSNVGDWHIYR